MSDTTHNKRIHTLDAAGAGDIGGVDNSEVLGPCPSCAAELLVTYVKYPPTDRMERALMHPVPFCTYYGETDPGLIESAVEQARGEKP